MDQQPIQPPPPGKDSNFENPEDALHTVNLVAQVLCIVVVTLFVALRLIAKARLQLEYCLEDYMTAAGWATFVAFCGCMLLLNVHGGGYNAWDVPQSKYIPFQKASYATTLIYVPMVFIVKLALLSIMLRIFSPDRHKVIVLYATEGVLLLYYIPALFIKVFFCKPVSAYWTSTSREECMDEQKVIVADSVISIVSDLWILILPVALMWSLRMSRAKKLRVIGMLGAGGLATAFSIWRLVIMVVDGRSTNRTYFWIHAVLTANAEAGLGLLCATLPALSAFVASVRGKGSSSGSAGFTRHHELDRYHKSSRTNRSGFSPGPRAQNDETFLITTAQGGEPHESSSASLTSENQNQNPAKLTGIQKNVTVSQSYEVAG